MVEFAGWEMPIQYTGIVSEHLAVRQHAGLFDVSHMGRILVEGLQAETFLDYLSTNVIAGKPDGTAIYTVLCHENGGCVDDVIIYRIDQTHFFVVVNAGNRQKDLDHLIKHSASFDVTIKDRFKENGILAIQGPAATEIVNEVFPEAADLAPMHFKVARYHFQEAIVSATGYTGAGGVEIYAPLSAITALWDELLSIGKSRGLVPAGLGARDTLRLEMGYALYGHELADDIRPIESVSHWTVKSGKHDFLGKEFQVNERSQYGIVLLDKGIAREGYNIYKDNALIGHATSGTFSPSLQKAIAIVISSVPLEEGDFLEVQIRQNRCKAQVVKLPFLVSLSTR
jgi:aminomethyltransferase